MTAAITKAVRGNDAAALREALRDGANPDIESFEGLTPLMGAAGRGYRDTIVALLDGGAQISYANADVNAGVDANTAMIYPAFLGELDRLRLILERGNVCFPIALRLEVIVNALGPEFFRGCFVGIHLPLPLAHFL